MIIFSIIMPAHNSSLFIEEAINSVLEQTFNDWELIVIDDHSNDDTALEVKKFSSKDSRIKFISLNENLGPALARNQGISIAKGRYISFIDSDDYWYPSKLLETLNLFNQTDCSIVFTAYIKADIDNRVNQLVMSDKVSFDFKDLLFINMIGCSTASYDTKKCGKLFMPNIRYAEDYSLWLKILSAGGHAIQIKKPLVRYNIRPGSESSMKLYAAIGHWRALDKYSGKGTFKNLFYFSFYVFRNILKLIKSFFK